MFEYKVIHLQDFDCAYNSPGECVRNTKRIFDDLGKDGWKLVAVTMVHAFFMKELNNNRTRPLIEMGES